MKLLPALALLVVSAAPGQDLPQWVLSLSRIKRQTKEELSRLPNYACLETVSRYHKTANGTSFKPLDTLRIEVAYIGGKELFAPQGGKQFQDLDLSVFASAGALGTGAFTSTARNLFVNDAARTTGWGQEKLDGRDSLWYGFEIPEMYHAYTVSYAGTSAFVGERGKFWVDAQTLELLRIEDNAFDIPSGLGLREVTSIISYTKIPIGGANVRLPHVSEMLVTESTGIQNKNITEFTNCREFGSESLIRFGGDDPEPAPPAAPRKK